MMVNDTCGHSADYTYRNYQFAFVVYNICTPLYFIFVLPGQIILLCAFLKQLKSERTYAYQVYGATAEAMKAVASTLYFCSMQIDLSISGTYWHSFQESMTKCYACVWYSARLARPLAATFCTMCMLLATAMAADRVLALVKPLKYQTINRKLWHTLIVSGCLVLSISASAVDFKKFSITAGQDGRYVFGVDVAYMSQSFVAALAFYRVTLQVVGLISLTILSVALCYLYRTRFVNEKLKLITEQEQRRVKAEERTLVFLTLFACAHNVAYMTASLSNTAISYGFPALYTCWFGLMVPTVDICRMIIDTSCFYGALALSKKFRQMVRRVMCFRNKTTSVVKLIAVHPGHSA